MKNIFPKEFITQSVELHRYNHLKKSRIVYLILIIGLIITSFLLPFIDIDLYTASRGMIRPKKQRNLINSPINGKVEKVNVIDNSPVNAGDTLVILENNDVSLAILRIKNQSDSLKLETKDIQYLLRNSKYHIDSLQTNLQKSQVQEHLFKVKSLEDNLNWNQKDFTRQEKLFHLGVIARKEFESSTERLESYENALRFYKSQQKRIWQNQLKVKFSELRILRAKLLEFDKEKSQHYIIAPIDGTIQDLVGIEKNNFVYTGSSIAHISPQTDLLVECFVTPSDIGMIKKNHPVTFQVDAFDHNYWGLATGKIIQISEDNLMINNVPMFKVICSLNEKKLLLDKNIQGKLKKGMTLKAHFFIKTRTLLQLVFDKLNDWY
jgi:multidrug resistance efflux pump